MLKNLKHSIVFILIVITLIFVVVMSLAASKPVQNINTAAVSAQNGNESKYGKWSGLGMGLYFSQARYVDTLLANGFTELRIDIPDYQNTSWLASSKASLPGIIAKGAKVIWGVSSYETTITSTNWPTFRQAILDAAQWAQNNGVFEFQIGNEIEGHHDGTITDAQVRDNLKSVATEVQAIFTRGNISYSCEEDSIASWASIGKGDIDILALNVYMGGKGVYDSGTWKTQITNMINAFGVDGTYITEFNISGTSLDDYSEDEAVQAAAVTEMIDYIKASGMTRAIFFTWHDTGSFDLGVVKDDDTYRLLWSQALLNTESVKSTTDAKTTTKISLPDTIALLISKITRKHQTRY